MDHDGGDPGDHRTWEDLPGARDLLWRWPTTEVRRILAGCFALLAVLALGLVVAVAVEEADEVSVLRRRGVTADATITGAVQENRTTSAVISFTTSAGRSVEVGGVEIPGPLLTGRSVPVTYDPQDPAVVRASDQVTLENAAIAAGAAAPLAALLVVQVVRAARPLAGWRTGDGRRGRGGAGDGRRP